LIDFDEASFGYGQRTVLEGVSLALEPGSFQILLGPSGAGKTTFVRLCYRDLAPTAGTLRFFGAALRPGDRDAVAGLRRRIGVLHQESRFLDHLPLIENIALPLRAGGIAEDLRAGDLAALLEWVDLADRAAAPPSTLTAAERQRAALARAVILSPELILADEPTGGVDRTTARGLMTLLADLNRMGKTVLVATHDAGLAEGVPGALLLRLEEGRVWADEEVAA
jgi:cell division transport system ATP-binding protein